MDVSAVSGFGVNLSFTATIPAGSPAQEQYGVSTSVTRAQIAEAFTKFIGKETQSTANAACFAELLYDSAIDVPGAPTPPSVGGQYFAISDPNDMLGALTANYTGSTTDPLASYWDDALDNFFQNGKYLSINLSAGAPNIYSGQCSLQTNSSRSPSAVDSLAYVLSGAEGTFTFYKPLPSTGAAKCGLTGARYVFQQAFGQTDDLTPAGGSNDPGLIQDCIWEALCRGVAQAGVSDASITNGESTTAWNNSTNWYAAGSTCHFYSKFMHYGTVTGTDSRLGGTPIFYGNSAYGFSEDENPDGLYTGSEVPSKTVQSVGGGSAIVIVIGPFGTPQSTYSVSGTVYDNAGEGQKDVTITLSGEATGTATTAANGTYSFNNLLNGKYVVTPSLAGYTFSPTTSSVTIAGANQSGQNFTSHAVAPGTYSISGTVSGDVVEDVTVTLSGDSDQTTTTDDQGKYSLVNLINGNYTVTPTKSGYTFAPASLPVTISGADMTGQDFTSTGAELAVGFEFVVDAGDVTGLPTGKFMVKPKLFTSYDTSTKDGVESSALVLTNTELQSIGK